MIRIDESGKPMMSDLEIEAIEKILDDMPQPKCLEWGSGNSTVHFSKRNPADLWVSVEHDGNYIKHLAKQAGDNVVFIWAPEDAYYVDCVKLNGPMFDFILIDGIDRHREKCLEAAFDLLMPGGVILLHDSGRKEYQPWIEKYPERLKLCDGEKPTGDGYFMHRGLTAFKV